MPKGGNGNGGNGGSLTIRGTKRNDLLQGTDAAETLLGKAGDDTLIGGGGGDMLDGGDGTDTASYQGSDASVEVDLSTGSASGGDAEGDSFISIENLIGSDHDDTLKGDASNNIVNGGAGNDLLIYSAGGDTLIGGDGYDTVDFSSLNGGLFSDGDPRIGPDPLYDQFQTPTYVTGVERIIGTEFADTLYALNSIVDLEGRGGDDMLTGGAEDNILDGGMGDDTLLGGGGADTLIGGDGIDTAIYVSSGSGVTVDLDAGTGIGGDAEGDSLTEIENLTGSALNDTLKGDENDNVLSGGDGDDLFFGGLGLSEISGGGADTYFGGDGYDTVTYEFYGLGVDAIIVIDEDLTFPLCTDIGPICERDDLFYSIERIVGTQFNDIIQIVNSPSGVEIDGGAGDDLIDGSDVGDRLFGDAGADTLQGGFGADILNGGDGVDTASYASSGDGVTVDLATGAGLGGDAEGDTLSGIENLTGSSHDDTLIGDGGDNTILGGYGDDVLVGGLGMNKLDGGDGIDTADYSGAHAGVEIMLDNGIFGPGGENEGVAYTYEDYLIDDLLTGVENAIGSAFDDALVGSDEANILDGGGGADLIGGYGGDDTIFGGDGDDLIGGLRGDDMIDGGAGADIIFFEWHTWVGGDGLGDGTDVVLNFEDGVDLIGFGVGVGQTFDPLPGVTADGDDTLISYGTDGSTIRLVGVDSSLIGAEDFVFEEYEVAAFIG